MKTTDDFFEGSREQAQADRARDFAAMKPGAYKADVKMMGAEEKRAKAAMKHLDDADWQTWNDVKYRYWSAMKWAESAAQDAPDAGSRKKHTAQAAKFEKLYLKYEKEMKARNPHWKKKR